jgi:hypothetical protein
VTPAATSAYPARVGRCRRRHLLEGVRHSPQRDFDHLRRAQARPPANTTIRRWKTESGFLSLVTHPTLEPCGAGATCLASQIRLRTVHLDCAQNRRLPTSGRRDTASLPYRAAGTACPSERYGEPGSGSSPHLVQSTIAPRARLPHAVIRRLAGKDGASLCRTPYRPSRFVARSG